jgi:hypothetical protein
MKTVFLNAEENRLRAGWRILVLLLTTLMVSLASAYPAKLGWWPSSFTWVAYLSMASAALLAVVAGIDRRRPLQALGFKFGRGGWRDLTLGFLVSLSAMGFMFALSWRCGWVQVDGGPQAGAGIAFYASLAGQLAFYSFSVFYEEALCRGYLLRNLYEGFQGRHLGPKAASVMALVVSSLLFGLMHVRNRNATILSFLVLVLLGGLMGWVYLVRGSLAMPIGLHLGWNFAMGTIFGLPVSGVASGTSVFIVREHGPALWTGDGFGPDAGMSGLLALLTVVVILSVGLHGTAGRSQTLFGNINSRRGNQLQEGGE